MNPVPRSASESRMPGGPEPGESVFFKVVDIFREKSESLRTGSAMPFIVRLGNAVHCPA